MALVLFGILGRQWWSGPVKLADASELTSTVGLREARGCVVECKEGPTAADGSAVSVCGDVCATGELGARDDSGGWRLFGTITFFLGLLALALSVAIAAFPGALDGAPGLPRQVALATTVAGAAALLSAIVFIALAPTDTPALWLGAHAFLVGGALCAVSDLRALTAGFTEPATAATDSAFADDPPLARTLRRIDRAVGLAEQVVMFALLIFLVLAAFAWFLFGVLHEPHVYGLLDESIDGVGVDIRYGVFLTAMVGGAFATHHRRLLSMDIASRLVGARSRAWLRVGLTLFAAEMALIFFGYGQIIARETGREEAIEHWLPSSTASWAIALGAGLIAFHLIVQIAIDLDYLLRDKTPPEPEQGVA